MVSLVTVLCIAPFRKPEIGGHLRGLGQYEEEDGQKTQDERAGSAVGNQN